LPAAANDRLRVVIRDREVTVRAVKFPFVRDGQACAGI
ncbi:MAG: glycine cleavage system protein T, partial [Lysobacterales bacterium CG02_land_8_20_14_3_00_62_12]